jgi:DNA-binding CsgD family transcriptional regulator/PAS domain-containing protein
MGHARRLDEAEVIGTFYDAALGHIGWAEAGQALISTVDGATLTLTAQHRPGGDVDMIEMHGVTPEEVALYAESFIPDDLWRNRAIGQRILDRVVLGTDLVSDLEYRNSRLYTDLVRPNTDVFHGVMVTATLPGGGAFSLGIHKPRLSSPFQREAAERLQRLLPHLRRAVQLRAQLADAVLGEQALRRAVDHAPQAMALLAPDGRVVVLNAAAQRIVEARDGLALGRSGGLQAQLAADQARLQATIRGAAATTAGNADGSSGGHIGISRPSGRRSYVLTVSPLGLQRPVARSSDPAVAVILSDPDEEMRIDERPLMSVFGLTAAEARVAALLTAGRSLAEIAAELQIGFETVRTHLARARAKTGTASQVDLVRLILRSLAPLPPLR